MNMKPTPELINDWHEKARQMALQADGYFDDVEHWRHFAELAAAWGAEKARQTTVADQGGCGDQEMTTDAERDCKHGQLARSCNVCELESEVARQAAEIERLKAELGDLPEAQAMLLSDCKVKGALLRQALEALAKYTTPGVLGGRVQIDAELVAAIKQHLGETHGN